MACRAVALIFAVLLLAGPALSEEEKAAKPDPNSPAGKLHRGAQQSNLKLIKEALSEGAYIDDKSPPCPLPQSPTSRCAQQADGRRCSVRQMT